MKLIDKDAVVAEVEKIREHVIRLRYAVDANCIVTIRNACECLESSIDLLVNSIDTLEVKEVDFEREPSKYATKIKPKFHKDEWIVHHGTENIYQVVACIDNQYQLRYGDNYTVQKCVDVDRCARLWDVTKDAKNGDVLVCPLPKGYEAGEQIFIFKGINSRDYVDDCIEYYCRICKGVFYENKNGYMGTTSSPLHPATEEQRDLLFQKMREAGYEWNADKKELKKL